MKLGVFGGSFDPIHLGHVRAAEAVRDARGLARVLFVPALGPPHKSACAAGIADRVAMARLAVHGREGLEVSEVEAERAPPSYTMDTLEVLAERHPEAELELLVGADMLADLPGWRRAGEIVARARVVAFGRPSTAREQACRPFEEAFGADRYVWVEIEPFAAESSEIRRRLAADESVEGLLPNAVLTYIRRRKLYGVGG